MIRMWRCGPPRSGSDGQGNARRCAVTVPVSVVEVADQLDVAINMVDPGGAGFAVGAVFRVNSRVPRNVTLIRSSGQRLRPWSSATSRWGSAAICCVSPPTLVSVTITVPSDDAASRYSARWSEYGYATATILNTKDWWTAVFDSAVA
jgi:hypothetical protein